MNWYSIVYWTFSHLSQRQDIGSPKNNGFYIPEGYGWTAHIGTKPLLFFNQVVAWQQIYQLLVKLKYILIVMKNAKEKTKQSKEWSSPETMPMGFNMNDERNIQNIPFTNPLIIKRERRFTQKSSILSPWI